MTENQPQPSAPSTDPEGPAAPKGGGTVWSGQGRQLFAYYALLFLFLVLGRELLIEIDSRFSLAAFPKLAANYFSANAQDNGIASGLETACHGSGTQSPYRGV